MWLVGPNLRTPDCLGPIPGGRVGTGSSAFPGRAVRRWAPPGLSSGRRHGRTACHRNEPLFFLPWPDLPRFRNFENKKISVATGEKSFGRGGSNPSLKSVAGTQTGCCDIHALENSTTSRRCERSGLEREGRSGKLRLWAGANPCDVRIFTISPRLGIRFFLLALEAPERFLLLLALARHLFLALFKCLACHTQHSNIYSR